MPTIAAAPVDTHSPTLPNNVETEPWIRMSDKAEVIEQSLALPELS